MSVGKASIQRAAAKNTAEAKTTKAATTNAAMIPRTNNSSKREKPFLLFLFLINTVFFISFISPVGNRKVIKEIVDVR